MNRRQFIAALSAGFGYFLGGCLQSKGDDSSDGCGHWWEVGYNVCSKEQDCVVWYWGKALVCVNTDDPDKFPYDAVDRLLNKQMPANTEAHIIHDAIYYPPARVRKLKDGGISKSYHLPWNKSDYVFDMTRTEPKIYKRPKDARPKTNP